MLYRGWGIKGLDWNSPPFPRMQPFVGGNKENRSDRQLTTTAGFLTTTPSEFVLEQTKG